VLVIVRRSLFPPFAMRQTCGEMLHFVNNLCVLKEMAG
jgi:hypothetical protein